MKRYTIVVNGNAYDVQVEEVTGAAPAVATPAVAAAPAAAATVAAAPAPAPSAPAVSAPAASAPVEGVEVIEAPMPGNIIDVLVQPGKSVSRGDVLVILESMKMENEIMAPHDGMVAAVHVQKGDTVESGAALVSLG